MKSKIACSMRLVLGLISLFIGYKASSQSLTQEQLLGKWIGVHIEFDTDMFCTIPTYVELGPDSLYKIGMIDGTASPKVSTWQLRNQSIRLDTLIYTPEQLTVTNNLLQIGKRYPMTFRRFQEAPMDSLTAFQFINGQVWETDSLRVSFFATGKVLWENRQTGLKTVHCWQLAKQGKSVFLLTRGNATTCDGNYKPHWQILNLGNRQFRAVGSNGRGVVNELFRFVRKIGPDEVCQTADFQYCTNCFTNMWYDYADKIDWNSSPKLYEVRKVVKQYYQPVQKKDQSGLIQVRFAVNCEGRVSPCQFTGLDENYTTKTFDPQITEQLQTICRTHLHHDWSRKYGNDQVIDVSILLNFRLKNGAITDIYL